MRGLSAVTFSAMWTFLHLLGREYQYVDSNRGNSKCGEFLPCPEYTLLLKPAISITQGICGLQYPLHIPVGVQLHNPQAVQVLNSCPKSPRMQVRLPNPSYFDPFQPANEEKIIADSRTHHQHMGS